MADVDMLPSVVTFVDKRACFDYKAPEEENVVIRFLIENVVKPASVLERIKSGQGCHRIPDVLARMYGHKVHSLDLSYNELTSLRGLEMFPLLRELVLDNNHLTDNVVFPYMPYLHTLSLNKNRLTDIEGLITKIRHNLPALNYLSLLGNKACPNQLSDLQNDDEDYERYRYYVLHHIQHLRFLDSRKVSETELIEAKRRGQFMKVVRPKVTEETKSSASTPPPTFPFTPLPKNMRDPSDQRGAYGKCRYRYSGKHSEGNRFICNNDL